MNRKSRNRLLSIILLLAARVSAWPEPTELIIQTGRRIGELVAVSPGGEYFVNTGAQLREGCLQDLTLWNRDGRLLRVFQSGIDLAFSEIAFSPEGSRFVCSGIDKSTGNSGAEVWDLYGKLVFRIGADRIRRYLRVVFSPDGAFIAGCGQDAAGKDRIVVWNAAGELRFEAALPTSGEAQGLRYSQDGGTVVCLLAKTGLGVLDLGTRKLEIIRLPEAGAENSLLEALAVSPDGSSAASCLVTTTEPQAGSSEYEDVRKLVRPVLWRRGGAGFTVLEETVSNVWFPVGGIAFPTPDRLLLAVNGQTIERRGNGTVFYWHFSIASHDLKGGGSSPFAGERGRLSCLAATPEGTVFGSGDAIRIWDSRGRRERYLPDSWVSEKGSIRFSPDGSCFLSGIHPTRLWSMDGRLIREFNFDEDRYPGALAFTPEGNILAAHAKGYDVFDPAGRVVSRYDGVDAWSWRWMDIETDGSRVFVPASEEGVWALDVKGGEGFPIRGGGYEVAPSRDGAYTACSRRWSEQEIYVFDRLGQEISVIPPERGFRMTDFAVDTAGSVVWIAEDLRAGHRSLSVWVRRPGSGSSRRIPLVDSADTGSVYRVTTGPGGTFAVFSTDIKGPIWVFGPDGGVLRKFDARQGGVTAAALTPDGKRLISSGLDSSLKVWNLDTRQSATLLSEGGDWIIYTDDLYFDASPKGGRLLSIVQGLRSYAVDQVALMRNRPDLIFKRLGLGDGETERYFHRQYIKRLVKADRFPVRIPADSYETRILAAASEPAARILAGWYSPSGKDYVLKGKPGLEDRYRLLAVPSFLEYLESEAAGPLHAPEARILSSRRDGDYLVLRCRFSDAKLPLSRYNVYVNEVPVHPGLGRLASGGVLEVEERIKLSAGPNKVEISCQNSAFTESLRASLEVSVGEQVRGSLYFIGFGVSRYRNEDFNLVFPRKDVEDLKEALLGTADRFDRVYTYTFTDQECTPGAVREAKKFLSQADTDDTVVLFISGHGLHDRDPDATYYYLTHDADVDNLAQTAADFETIEDILDGIRPRKKLFLMDTCESGEHDEFRISDILASAASRGLRARTVPGSTRGGSASSAQAPRGFLAEKDRFIQNDLFRRTGAIVFSSSRGGEFSYEPAEYSPKENGFFTGAILRSLRSLDADSDGDGEVGTDELRDYVTRAVSLRSEGLQNPTVDRDNTHLRFGLALSASALTDADPRGLERYLAAAVRAGNIRAVRDLLGRGVRMTAEDGAGALAEAAGDGSAEIVRLLLRHGADPKAGTASGASPAKKALDGGHREILWALIDAGASVPARAVLEAQERGDLARLRDALKSGRRVEREGRQEAFWMAVQKGYVESVEIFLRAGVNAGPAEWRDDSPVKLASRLGHREVERLLIEKIESAHKVLAAVEKGDGEELARLISRGAFVGVKGFEAMGTPLLAASGRGDAAAVRILLAAGADPDDRDMDGATALIAAARAGSVPIVRMLLEAGADPTLRTVRGLTAFEAARMGGHTEAAELLKQD